ncbi:putative immunity protein [Anaerorhabdus sp.]|uniref:putative immunity protein n=1 Tax=Anaerorhabdus sp. TaxID=1872524 RepID=UPI002B1F67CC|nr:hypothetical protein [Anaerorhabdus sp.]MEA4874953.1 hypothetical protein [Anaerorhabdus sp.]
MLENIEEKLKKKNTILFSRESECLQELIFLIQQQNHRTLVLWAFECIKVPLKTLERKYSEEFRAQNAFEICQRWARGEEKMPAAKRAILECHAVCKEINDKSDIALYHAIGQGLSTIHVETHAIGLPIYELSAIVFSHKEDYEIKVKEKIEFYKRKIDECKEKVDRSDLKWAGFLMKDKPNKEKLLALKEIDN